MKKVVCIFLLFIFSFFYFSPKVYKVYAVEWVVCPTAGAGCSHVGGDGIQQAVDEAKNGDTIIISPGTYSGGAAVPLGVTNDLSVSNSRGGANTCFIRIEGKQLILKGDGAVLFGEGHDKPYQDPYTTRAGICIINSDVTINSLRIKEFQKRAAVVYNSKIVVKNSLIDGNDEGGVSLVGNSSGLFVNNLFVEMNFGGIMLWGNSTAKIVNNTFYKSVILFFYHPSGTNNAKADIINNIIVGNWGNTIGQVDWWPSEYAKLKNNNYSYNILWDEGGYTCQNLEYCDQFPGRIEADPLFNVCSEPRGLCGGSLDPLTGSPALRVGDPNIPGPKNLGHTGGPCANPNSSICATYIQANFPSLPQPTEPPPQPPPEPPPGPGPDPGPGPGPNPGPNPDPQGTIFSQIINPYNLPKIFGALINLPNNVSLLGGKNTKALSQQTGMDLMMYIAFSAVYIMFIHFAVGIKNEFNIFWMIGYFVLGGVIGGWLQTYEGGFVFSIIMSLLFF